VLLGTANVFRKLEQLLAGPATYHKPFRDGLVAESDRL
jgi:hypothetical protein